MDDNSVASDNGGGAHKVQDSANSNQPGETSHDKQEEEEEEEQQSIQGESMRADTIKTMDTSMETLKEGGDDPAPSEELITTTPVKSFADFSGYELGGKSDKPAYCLLDGFYQEVDGNVKPFRCEIDRLPATLGRTHNTSESNFFGLGKNAKALSRYQCRIDYRVPSGNLGQFTSSDEFTYRAGKVEDLNNPTGAELSESGIYVLTCLGKNAVKVNGLKVEQNETCILPHGSTVKFSSFSMYFLLPATPSPNTMELPLKGKRKRKAQPDAPTSSSGGGGGSNSPPNKKSKIPAFKTLQDELEKLPTEDLLAQLEIAHSKNIWDRRCQFLGATLSYRAVREAAQSTELQMAQATASAQAPGISKQEVVQWIHESDKFATWAEIMRDKLEPKSYQTNIAKAMQRAGYERSTNVSVGRHVRWYLPADLCPRDTPAAQEPAATNKEEGDNADAAAPQDKEDDNNKGDDDDDDNAEETKEEEVKSQEEEEADGE